MLLVREDLRLELPLRRSRHSIQLHEHVLLRILPEPELCGVDAEPELAVLEFDLRRDGDAVLLLRGLNTLEQRVLAALELRDHCIILTARSDREHHEQGSPRAQRRGRLSSNVPDSDLICHQRLLSAAGLLPLERLNYSFAG